MPATPTLSAAMANTDVILSWVHTAVEATGNVAFALSGLLAGIRKRLDVVGLCVVTGLAAFGGGTLRDVLLDRRPFFWVAHSEWLWIVIRSEEHQSRRDLVCRII